MNMTEQAIIGTIVVAIGGSIVWLGSKAFDEIEGFTDTVYSMPEEKTQSVLAEMAELEAQRAELLARQQAEGLR